MMVVTVTQRDTGRLRATPDFARSTDWQRLLFVGFLEIAL
jgi:hypothetical protein